MPEPYATSLRQVELDAEIARLQLKIDALKFGLEKEQSMHANTNFYCQELTGDPKKNKWQLSEVTEQRKQLPVDQADRKKVIVGLKKWIGIMHSQLMELMRVNKLLEKDYNELKV